MRRTRQIFIVLFFLSFVISVFNNEITEGYHLGFQNAGETFVETADGLMSKVDDVEDLTPYADDLLNGKLNFPCLVGGLVGNNYQNNLLYRFLGFGAEGVEASSGCARKVGNNHVAIGDELFKVGKTSTYRGKFVNNLTNAQRLEVEDIMGVVAEELDVNHRLPPGILKDSKKGLADLLKRMNIDDINSTRLTELMDPTLNRVDHRKR